VIRTTGASAIFSPVPAISPSSVLPEPKRRGAGG
jgi:hypothetical protein